MKLAWMMTMMTATGLAACVADSTESVEATGTGDSTTAAPPAETLAETTSALTSAEEAAAIPVASTEIARVLLFYGDLVYYAPAAQEPSDTAGTPPTSSVRPVISLEISRPDSAGRVRGLVEKSSALDEYLTATPATVPVPRALLASEGPGPVRDRALQRPIVESLPGPVTGLPELQLTSQTVALGSVSDWCTGGSSASFAADVCTRTNWDVDFCHNGTWASVTDDVGSSNKRRDSRSRTLACGANGRVRHYYKSGGIWYKPIDETIPSNQMWRWTKWGNWALARAITHSRTASGFVRGASHFNIPF